MATVVILYDGTDITEHVVYGQTNFTSQAGGQPGSCNVVIDNRNHDFGPGYFTAGKTIELFVNGAREWDGWVFVATQGWPFPVDETTVPAGVPTRITLAGYDRNILFQKRIIYRLDNPIDSAGLKAWPQGTWDKTALNYVMNNYVDLSDDGLTIQIKHVGSPGPYEAFTLGYVGAPMGLAFEDASKMTGAVYFIDPSRVLRYVGDTDVTAPFALSDAPTGSQVGYRELSAVLDGTKLANEARVWGAGKGSSTPVFAKYKDNSSVNTYGLWQWGNLYMGAYKQKTVDRRAETYVEGSPSHRRGHGAPVPSVKCTIFEPGIRAGHVVDFHADTYG